MSLGRSFTEWLSERMGWQFAEDDAEPELLEDESMELVDGDIVAMAVKVGSVLSATFPAFHLLRSRTSRCCGGHSLLNVY
jgi:hypothetical protein